MRRRSSWRSRFLTFASITVAPFVEFLARNGYGLFRAEVAALMALLLMTAAGLGWLARDRLFLPSVVAGAVLVVAFPLKLSFPWLPYLPDWAVLAMVSLLFSLLALLLRERLCVVLPVFLWGNVAMAVLWQHWPDARMSAGPVHSSVRHLIWIVFDEQIGLAGFPPFPECERARSHWEAVLERYRFTRFPRAYSNYAVTLDSLASVANSRLLNSHHELIERQPGGGERYQLRENHLFATQAAQGFLVQAFQHASLRSCLPGQRGQTCFEYEDKLELAERAPGGWFDRLGLVVGAYQASDPYRNLVKGFFPFRFRQRLTFPLLVSTVWPEGIAEAVLRAQRPTFFFAHLLIPHFPYLYRRDGSVRPIEEWDDDRVDRRLDQSQYRAHYRRYCEQSEFTARQLGDFLGRLESAGALETATVVLHGDHGSRIRRQGSFARIWSCPPEVFDYVQDPDGRDLTDRFSTMLAVRHAHARRSVVRMERRSLLTLLALETGLLTASDAAADDQVFLLHEDNRYRPLDVRSIWGEEK